MIGLSHIKISIEPGSSGESDVAAASPPGRPKFSFRQSSFLSPKQNTYPNSFLKDATGVEKTVVESRRGANTFSLESPKRPGEKRILDGQVYAEIPLEAAKAYPIRIFDKTSIPPKIAYADWNTKKELNKLVVKLEKGGKTSPHPQIVMYVKGPYHVENLLYVNSNPYSWTTWMELYLDPRSMNLDNFIDALIRIKVALENMQDEKEKAQ